MATDPPTGMGQPPAWASAPRRSPAPAAVGEGRGDKACAATPVSSAGAASPMNRRFHHGEPCSKVARPRRSAAIGSGRHPQQLVLRHVQNAAQMLHQRSHEAGKCCSIGPEFTSRPLQRAIRESCPAAVERCSVLDLRQTQLHTPFELKIPEETRSQRHRVDSGTDVVDMPRFQQFSRPRSTTDRLGGLVHPDSQARAGHHYRGGQAVRSGADDGDLSHGVRRRLAWSSLSRGEVRRCRARIAARARNGPQRSSPQRAARAAPMPSDS